MSGGVPPVRRPAFKPGWPAALVAVAAIAALALVLGLRACVKPAEIAAEAARDTVGAVTSAGARAAENFAAAFRQSFNVQPTVTSGTRVVVTAPRDTARLVVVEQIVPARREITHEFLKSTKRLEAEGEFRLLAGYDLAKPFEVEVAGDGGVRILAPAPELLAVETLRAEIAGQDGLWNKISDDERNQALADLKSEARATAQQALVGEARAALLRLVADIDPAWRVVWPDTPDAR